MTSTEARKINNDTFNELACDSRLAPIVEHSVGRTYHASQQIFVLNRAHIVTRGNLQFVAAARRHLRCHGYCLAPPPVTKQHRHEERGQEKSTSVGEITAGPGILVVKPPRGLQEGKLALVIQYFR